MSITQKAKANPMMTIAITVITLTGGFTATWAGIGLVDQLHTTEAELLVYDLKAHTFASQQFAGLESKLEDAQVVNKCRWLKSEIRALKDSIYVRKRDDGDADYINDLENDLDDLEAEYNALTCVRLLA